MRTEAAVLIGTAEPLAIVQLETPALRAGQVLVALAFSGVCHTQLLEARGLRGPDRFLPHCLGHEGSGIVIETGDEVTRFQSDDRVILSWIKGEGADITGCVYDWDGQLINAGAVTTFNRHAVVSENRLTLLPDGTVSLRDAALLGCAIPTGVGAVLNTAKAKEGESVIVFGVGGVGLCAIGAAANAGCAPVVAVDPNPNRRALAIEMGATAAFDPAAADVRAHFEASAFGGFDVAIEASGRPAVMTRALEAVRPRGGRAVIVGNAGAGEMITVDPGELNLGKQLRGSWGGDHVPSRDFPHLFEMVATKRLRLDLLTGDGYGLVRINEALDDLARGAVARPLIDLSLS